MCDRKIYRDIAGNKRIIDEHETIDDARVFYYSHFSRPVRSSVLFPSLLKRRGPPQRHRPIYMSCHTQPAPNNRRPVPRPITFKLVLFFPQRRPTITSKVIMQGWTRPQKISLCALRSLTNKHVPRVPATQ